MLSPVTPKEIHDRFLRLQEARERQEAEWRKEKAIIEVCNRFIADYYDGTRAEAQFDTLKARLYEKTGITPGSETINWNWIINTYRRAGWRISVEITLSGGDIRFTR